MNWGYILGITMSVECAAASVAYLFQRDWRHAIYFALAAGINYTVIA